MQTSTKPEVETCRSCGALIDVSEVDPFALVNCSGCGAKMRVRAEFATFEIQGVLGEGGQGMVYRALDKKLHRHVAIKLMKREFCADPTFVKRFESEARLTAGLNHPNIVKVFSFGEHRGLVYLAMEIVDSGSLDALMTETKKVPEDRALEVGIQIAHGLKAGLARGLIHRDIKPGNILFADVHTAKLVDFGLAVLVEKQHEESGDVWATPFYVSPEKLDGRPEDFRSDMYSLAATLFHAIAGRPPFTSESNSMAELRQIKGRPVQLRSYAPNVSPATAHAIDKAMSVGPKDRFESYDEFIEHLEYARGSLRKQREAAPVPRVVKMGDPSRNGSWITFTTVALIVGMGLYLWVSRSRSASQRNASKSRETQAQLDRSAEAAFDEGRRQLVEKRFKDAAATFLALHEGNRLPEPKNSWAAIHAALAETLAGQPGPARKIFISLADRINPTAIGMDPKLAAFMTQLAASGSRKQNPDFAEIEKFDKTTYACFAWLILGAGAWESGFPEDGVGLLRRFANATPSGDSAWVGDYKPLATRYVNEFSAYKDVADALMKVDEAPAEAEAALSRAAKARETIKSGALLGKLAKLETEATAKLAAAKAAIERQGAEALANDEKTLTTAKFQVKELCENYRFAAALAVMQAADLKLARSITERDLLTRRIEWLVHFKQRLIDDLNVGSYTWPIVRKNGQQLVGGVQRATDQQLEIRLQFGSVPVPWSDLSPQTVLQMARSYMKPSLLPAALADRKWEAGVFCLFVQLFSEGQALMDEASSQKEEYRTHRALLFGKPAPDATPPPAPKPAPEPKPASDTRPSSGVEMVDEPLNPTKTGPASTLTKGPPRSVDPKPVDP